MYHLLQHRIAQLTSSETYRTLASSKTGLEKESLRVQATGGIAQTKHPQAWGAALTHPQITTDFSEALTELITPPCDSVEQAIQTLDEIQCFVYRSLDKEILWATSMPCVMAGGTNIPLAQYGSSNAAKMKTIYRHGLGLRYGRSMQVIAGVHFNYSFSIEFWQQYQQLLDNNDNLQDFISEQYMGLIRNLLRYGWLVPYLFGASPAVCKSFLNHKKSLLQEFNETTYYEPYATSLRLGDIGYQNNKEELAGIKANYNSLAAYIKSMQCAISTTYESFEKIGLKKNGQYQQLNTNILQIENEYYSSARPKQVPQSSEKPSTALSKRGIAYVELRSLDVNAFDPHGINLEQLYFLEVFMLFCLLQKSPSLCETELNTIDENLLLVAHQGRKPGLDLQRGEEKISLQDWANELCRNMKGVANLLDKAHFGENYFSSVKAQTAVVFDSALTPSARMLEEMRVNEEGFFQYAKRMSHYHYRYYQQQKVSSKKIKFYEDMAEKSIKEKNEIEKNDNISFEKYLKNYFKEV